jgi:hypothetical protein
MLTVPEVFGETMEVHYIGFYWHYVMFLCSKSGKCHIQSWLWYLLMAKPTPRDSFLECT